MLVTPTTIFTEFTLQIIELEILYFLLGIRVIDIN